MMNDTTLAKMSAKLVVHKFESETIIRSLQIKIEDLGNNICNTEYSEWTDSEVQIKKRDANNSRLVVKIVSDDNQYSTFNIDSCAVKIDHPEPEYLNNRSHRLVFNNYNKNLTSCNSDTAEKIRHEPQRVNSYFDRLPVENVLGGMKIAPNQSVLNHQDFTRNSDSNGKSVCPLEYSLEKVKENNAHIMENIHKLNRTLNYTKKKEILDILCPKTTRFPCVNCGKCFVYKTGLKRHLSTNHTIAEIPPRWQVVWTCAECFQVWPQQNLAMGHLNQCCETYTADRIREIKTSSLLQCEFCEKVYTSIPRLLRHSKTHTTDSNYECNACELSFVSYKVVQQHWLKCPWLKMCYSFALPKMLLCNTCDRKFRNYEQLYNHRYKVGHLMSKTHCNKGSVDSLGMLVYQCEICAQWMNTIPLLLAHRSQNHTGYDCPDQSMQCKIQEHSFIDNEKTYEETQENCHNMDDIENNEEYYYVKLN